MNLSQQKRERMLKFLNDLKEKNKSDIDVLKEINEIETELTSKKYGLIWEEHEENIDEQMKDNVPVFTEIKNKEIKINNKNYNFLLEGDNLHSLYLLEKTHKDKIDIIYIDPPYNTGSTEQNSMFKYNDKIVDSNDGYMHSQWLSFMEKRLRIAKNLLKKYGVIFISIDDNELFNLKLLCDSIFGSNNFLGNISQNKGNAQNDAKNIQKNCDYLLVYCNNRKFVKTDNRNVEETLLSIPDCKEKKVLLDENGNYFYEGSSLVTGSAPTLRDRINLGYTIYYNPKTKDKIAIHDYDEHKAFESNDEQYVYTDNKELVDAGYKIIRPPKKNGKLGRWTWELERFNREKNNIFITENLSVKQKRFIDESDIIIKGRKKVYYKKNRTNNLKSIIDFSSAQGTTAYRSIIIDDEFNNPKNVEMLKMIIESINNKNCIVLDFFAGSGTTAQAVLELNLQDDGNRLFILCTNNENSICEKITYQRIATVITGKRSDDTVYSNGINASLKYYKTDFISKSVENLDIELDKHTKELVQLENAVDIDDKTVLLAFDNDDLTKQLDAIKDIKQISKLYISRYVMLNSKQKRQLKNTSIEIIPDYYFKKELKEKGLNWR